MKASPTIIDDNDDIFGPPKTTYCAPKNRPSILLSGTYKHKDERKRVLKISANKFRNIKDTESHLHRCVLLCNTIQRLQKEIHEEKMRKRLNYPASYDKENLPIMNIQLREERTTSDDCQNSNVSFEEIMNTEDFSSSTKQVTNNIVEEVSGAAMPPFEEIDDRDLQEILSHFCSEPTPRLLTSIDDGVDANSVEESTPKKPKLENAKSEDLENFDNNTPKNNSRMPDANSFTCGQALMYISDMQNNAFQSLIPSLET